MTIEERAKRRSTHDWNGSLIDAYIQGAKEQEAITKEEMIDKACNTYCRMHCNMTTRAACYISPRKCLSYDAFKKALEK